MTNPIADITQNAQVLMLVGTNPEEAHPVLGMQIRQAVERGCRLILVDPRDIGLASQADIHLKLKPGTNVAFANGMLHVILKEGLYDRDFVENRTDFETFEKLCTMAQAYTPEYVASICNIDARDLVSAARMYAQADRAAIAYCLGVTEHSTGTDGVMSLSNLAMVTGKIGRPGCGVNPIRGQNNVQGACDVGAMPQDFTGYQKVQAPGVVEKFEKAWGTSLSHKDGLKSTECFSAMSKGTVKGLFIFGEDPVRTDPDIHHVIHALESVDFFVVCDLFMTATAKYADVILPGRSYAEKEGTFTNTERRIQRVRKAVSGPQGPRTELEIFSDLMRRMGYPQPTLSAAEIMRELASVTPSYGGVSHERLDSEENAGQGLQWPCPSRDHPGTPILHVGGFTRGVGTYSTSEYRPSTEAADADFPLILSTGRILYHYNACAMTGRTHGLNQIANASFIEVNTHDAELLDIVDGERVRVTSRRGSIVTTAYVSEKTARGVTWMPLHFQDGNCNWLTIAAYDNVAKVPEFKVCAVRIDKVPKHAIPHEGPYCPVEFIAPDNRSALDADRSFGDAVAALAHGCADACSCGCSTEDQNKSLAG